VGDYRPQLVTLFFFFNLFAKMGVKPSVWIGGRNAAAEPKRWRNATGDPTRRFVLLSTRL